jgi:superfamily II DNA/RNA helicase
VSHSYLSPLYEVYLPLVTDGEQRPYSLECIKDSHYSPRAAFLAAGMIRKGSRRCIAYLPTVEACELFLDAMKTAFETFHGESFWGGAITCRTTQRDRDEIISAFRNDDGDCFHVLASVKILDEGIDIPACDSIFVSEVSCKSSDRSHMRAVQRLCRAVRKDRSNPFKVARAFVYAEDDASLVDMFSLLKDNDPEFHLRVHGMSGDYNRTGTEQAKVAEAARENGLRDFIMGLESLEERALRRARQLVAWVKANGNRLPKRGKYAADAVEKELAKWLDHQKQALKGNKGSMTSCPDVRAHLDQHVPHWKWTREDEAKSKAKQLVDWVEKHDNRLPKRGAADAVEKELAEWLNHQKAALKGQGTCAWHPDVGAHLDQHVPHWSWTNEDVAMSKAKQLVDWVEKHDNRLPKRGAADAVEKELAEWLAKQRMLFRGTSTGSRKKYPAVINYLDQYISTWSQT